jgi:hypothetical protein
VQQPRAPGGSTRRDRRDLVFAGIAVAVAVGAVAGLAIASGRPLSLATPPHLVAPAGAVLFVGAGDISSCANDHDEGTARLIDSLDGQVFALGDLAYESGTASEYADCYGPTWGRFRARTHPVPGNHDYVTPNASAYFAYFGGAAGTPGHSWSAWDLNGWRIYDLDSNCESIGGCGEGTAELQWLRTDLAENDEVRCSLAMWHHPRYSSGRHGSDTRTYLFWSALAEGGADIVLTGHDHSYERFAPLDAAGHRDDARGIRSFVVGTGGKDLYEFTTLLPDSEVHDSSTFGVLALTLWPDHYEWHFLNSEGSFTDSGSGTCH